MATPQEPQSSEEFRDAICHGGSCWVVCDFCGTSYGEDNGDETYSIGWIEGKQMVWSCRCKESEERLSMIENFIVAHRHIVIDFLKLRAKRMKQDAEAEQLILEGAPNS